MDEVPFKKYGKLQFKQAVELWQSKQFDKLQGSHKLLPFRKWSDVSLQTEQAVKEEQVRQWAREQA